MELIKIENGTPILNKQVSIQFADFERQMNFLKDQEAKLKKAVLEEMEQKNIIGIDTEELAITYVPEYDREKFETKRFKADNPELYDDYVTMTPVKSSIRVKVKGE